jgi:hypothetical protein
VLNISTATVSQPAFDTANIAANSSTQNLVDNYRVRSGARRNVASIPIGLSFPAVGPSLYLVSELTGENKAAAVNLDYQKDKKGRVQ